MSIGLCCQYLKSKEKRNGTIEYFNAMEEKNLQFGRFNDGKYPEKQIVDTWISNLNNLELILHEIVKEGFKVFRMSSNLFPLYDSVNHLLVNNKEISSRLLRIGNYLKKSNVRVTCHPDQFCVLSSKNPEVIDKSIKILEHHAWIFDNMGLDCTPYYSINIHGGTKDQLPVLIDTIKRLPENVKSRLTLENDETCYSVKDLYACYEATGVPCCYDSHHHAFNNAGLTVDEGLELAMKTWSVKMLTHLSNTDPLCVNGSFKDRRKHSDYVHYIPDLQRKWNDENKIDIEFEFKMKNLAIRKAIKDFGIVL